MIKIKEPIVGEAAKFFQKCFPKGVVDVVKDENTGVEKAIVVDPRRDTVSREVLRHDRFKGKVELGRVRDHFICEFSNRVWGDYLNLPWSLEDQTNISYSHTQTQSNQAANLTLTSSSSKLSRY